MGHRVKKTDVGLIFLQQVVTAIKPSDCSLNCSTPHVIPKRNETAEQFNGWS